MITVNWQHIILDPAVFARAGTYRVQRARARGFSFPIADANTWNGDGTAWSPGPRPSGRNLKGWAPPNYIYPRDGGNRFNFGFWSIAANAAGAPRRRDVVLDREPIIEFGAPVMVEAKAWYYWDLDVGGGPHGAFIDAFDVSEGDFIADDFVDVVPDDEPGRPLTLAANDGYLNTDNIKEEVITARTPTGDSSFVQYELQNWRVMDDLIFAGPTSPEPTVIDRQITVRQGNIIFATAFYNRLPSPSLPLVRDYLRSFLIGDPARGFFIVTPLGEVFPGGPGDPPPDVWKQILSLFRTNQGEH